MAIIGMVLALVFGIVSLVAGIMLLISAFQISAGKGFMVLCIPFYAFIFAWSDEFQHPQKKMIQMGLVIGVVGNILARVLLAAGA